MILKRQMEARARKLAPRIHASHCSNEAEIDIQSVRLNSSYLENDSHFNLLALDVCALPCIKAYPAPEHQKYCGLWS